MDARGLVDVARRAEDLGYDSLWRGDHIAIPTFGSELYELYARSERSPAGAAPLEKDPPLLDALTVLAFVASATTSVQFATSVYVLPLRALMITARLVTTLDVLTGGRFMFGIGTGWLKTEFDVVGIPFESRGSMTTEYIRALKALWTQEDPQFEGSFFSIRDVKFEPKPIRCPHPPIVIGGDSPAALRRAAVVGDGWYGHAWPPEKMLELVRRLRELRREAGREHEPFELTARVKEDTPIEWIERFIEMGVDRISLDVGDLGQLHAKDSLPAIEQFARQVVRRFA